MKRLLLLLAVGCGGPAFATDLFLDGSPAVEPDTLGRFVGDDAGSGEGRAPADASAEDAPGGRDGSSSKDADGGAGEDSALDAPAMSDGPPDAFVCSTHWNAPWDCDGHSVYASNVACVGGTTLYPADNYCGNVGCVSCATCDGAALCKQLSKMYAGCSEPQGHMIITCQ
jgi:hypothetical protein